MKNFKTNHRLTFLLSLTLITSIFLRAGGVSATYSPFIDVPKTAWYADYVNELRDQGIVNEADYFRPADSLTRAELVKMVIEVLGVRPDAPQKLTTVFKDVPLGLWFSEDVRVAVSLAIVSGYTDAKNGNITGFFGPGDKITRAEAAKILVRAFNLSTQSEVTPTYSDVKEGDWFENYVMVVSQNGVMSGYGNGKFGPSDPVTRSQMAKMLVLSAKASTVKNLLKSTISPGDAPPTDEPKTPPLTTTTETPSDSSAGTPGVPDTSSLETANVSLGSKAFLVARYTFKANYENFTIDTLTIVNDVVGASFGDQTTGTSVIKNITLKFFDQNGKFISVSSPLSSDGTAHFSGVNFVAKRDKENNLEVYAELNELKDAGEGMSGSVFRLGLQNAGGNSQSFRAVGEFSNSVVNYNSGNLLITNQQSKPFTVRQSVPHFTVNSSTSTLVNGSNPLLSFNVAADTTDSIGLARLVFEVNVSDASGNDLQLKDFQLFRGSHLIDGVTLYDATGNQDLSSGSGNPLSNGTSFVIATFPQEEIISAGDKLTYSLKATVQGSQNDDQISTRLAQGDENLPLSGLNAEGQANTGKIYAESDASAGIFTSASDFTQALGVGRNIIWSDESASNHLYPTISGGLVNSNSGSADFTNGVFLGLTGLEEQVLSK